MSGGHANSSNACMHSDALLSPWVMLQAHIHIGIFKGVGKWNIPILGDVRGYFTLLGTSRRH